VDSAAYSRIGSYAPVYICLRNNHEISSTYSIAPNSPQRLHPLISTVTTATILYITATTSESGNLNSSDSGLHHTISLMYVGARHIEFWINSHIVT